MFRKIVNILGIVILAAFIVTTLAFTYSESKNIVCKNIQIKFAKNETIKINESEIIRLVKSADEQLIGKKLKQINTEILESEIEKHQAILNAEVYKIIAKDTAGFKGILAVKVKHRRPVLRIITSSANYYLDEFAGKIPSSTNYAANVMVASGSISEKFAKEKLLPFVIYVNKNDFWQAQIEQIFVDQNEEIILTPLVGNHSIEFGNLENYSIKLRNMKAFYQQVLAKNNWNKYNMVSLKYENQVVAKKR